MTTPWYDDPELAHVWDTPERNILAELRGHTEAARARLRAYSARDDRGEVFVFDAAGADQWLDSYRADEARDYDPEVA